MMSSWPLTRSAIRYPWRVLVTDRTVSGSASVSTSDEIGLAARRQQQRRFPVDPFAPRIEARIDVVVDDVEVDLVVFVEERAARRELFLRRIDRDRPAARAIEEADVLGVVHRLHVGEVRAVGVHLGDEIAELRDHRPSARG